MRLKKSLEEYLFAWSLLLQNNMELNQKNDKTGYRQRSLPLGHCLHLLFVRTSVHKVESKKNFLTTCPAKTLVTLKMTKEHNARASQLQKPPDRPGTQMPRTLRQENGPSAKKKKNTHSGKPTSRHEAVATERASVRPSAWEPPKSRPRSVGSMSVASPQQHRKTYLKPETIARVPEKTLKLGSAATVAQTIPSLREVPVPVLVSRSKFIVLLLVRDTE